MMDDRIVRVREVLRVTGLGRSTLYLRVRQGAFPAPIALGGRAVGWRWSDVAAWIAARPPRGGGA